MSGKAISNSKINGEGHTPRWGLKYLEPDIVIKVGGCTFVADAKYKAHFYAIGIDSESLKETHRSDLHQLLAYCSFEPQSNRAGILFYPSKETQWKVIKHTDRNSGSCATVILCGLAFKKTEMDPAIKEVKKMLKSLLDNSIVEA